MVADVRVGIRARDDGSTFNRVVAFAITAKATIAGTLDPDDDDDAHVDQDGKPDTVPF